MATRRALLGIALLGSHSHSAATAISLDEFLALSERLTGRTGLDRKAGRLYLASFLPDIARRGVSHPELEQAIILAWYTGVYQTGGKSHVATHSGALVWKAQGTAAPGTCSGEMGFWSKPPAEPR